MIESWNMRPTEDALHAELEELEQRETRLRETIEDAIKATESDDNGWYIAAILEDIVEIYEETT
jgi:hypothetical protein